MNKIETDKWFTQANISEGDERIFSQCIYLGKYDSPDNWIEWTEDEMNQYLESIIEDEDREY